MNRLLPRLLLAPAISMLFLWMTDAVRAAVARVQHLTNAGMKK